MAKFDYDLGVIGGGAAGLTVASGAAQFGAGVVLIEKEPVLGGDCLHHGCVPSKTLVKTARVYHQMKNASRFGLPQIPPVPVDFKKVAARIQDVIAFIQKHDSDERFGRLGVRVWHGNPCFTDEHTVKVDGKKATARAWVIATGSSPGVPPIPGLLETPHLTNREIFSLDHLPSSLIILGGGPIGIEMAQAFCRLGSEVHVVEMMDQIMGPEDKDMADTLMDSLSAEGVRFHLGAKCTRVRDLGNEKEVTLENPDGRRVVLKGEAILVALGRVPNVEGLGLRDVGVDYSRRGIEVTPRLRTSHKHIYAAGDVNGGYQFTHVAGYEGGVALTNAILHLPRKVDYSHICWCTYADPELASIGLNEKGAKKAGLEYKIYTEAFADNDRALAEGETAGRIKLILGAGGKPLGIQILGVHAGEIANAWVAVFCGKTSLSGLAGAIHPYPTLGEISKRVTGNVFAPRLYSPKVRKWLSFLFNYKGGSQE